MLSALKAHEGRAHNIPAPTASEACLALPLLEEKPLKVSVEIEAVANMYEGQNFKSSATNLTLYV